jgi:predicted enzyme related to lactoylglutathione lyase
MSTRLVHLVIDALDPLQLAAFWAAALGWETVAEDSGEFVVRPAGFSYPDPSALPLVFVPVSEPKIGKNRIHLDLATESAAHQAVVVDRLRSLGAAPVDIGQGQVPWVVLADPEGNELCVLEPRPVYADTGPIAAIVVDCSDPTRLARFWSHAADQTPHDSEADFASLRSGSGVGPYLEMLQVPGPKTVKDRAHLDVAPFPDDDHQVEVARLNELGAAAVDVGQGDVPWAVLADPEGNEFCVLTPR